MTNVSVVPAVRNVKPGGGHLEELELRREGRLGRFGRLMMRAGDVAG
jgi:hypothetical protein